MAIKHKFQYIAKSYSDGSEHRGTIEAIDRNSAIAAIRANGLMPTAIGQIIDEPILCKRMSNKFKHFRCNYIKTFLKNVAKAIDSFAEKI